MSRDKSSAVFDYKPFLDSLTDRPGIYQMLDSEQTVIYVGKARNLKKRVSQYFHRQLDGKTQRMVAQVADIKVILTNSETEALILESNLIKQYRPKYNVLLRDDKSYPYIYLSSEQNYPRLTIHRGARKKSGEYFGPYPNARSVRQSLHLLEKLFKVRQCQDSYFQNRTRPCLQYQIKRCSGPCVELVSQVDYKKQVDYTRLFLQGKNKKILEDLKQQMEAAAKILDYENAAYYRDLIQSLQHIQEQQFVSGDVVDLDAVAICEQSGHYCIELLMMRGGRILGSQSFYPNVPIEMTDAEVLAAFLAQHYLKKHDYEIPAEIIINKTIPDLAILNASINVNYDKKIKLHHPQRGKKIILLKMAYDNAEHSLQHRPTNKNNIREQLLLLQNLLQLESMPTKIECFDISHSFGENAVASCVVYDDTGKRSDLYRRFNLKEITAGDDYAAMKQALERRYQKVKDDPSKLPDILLIDGGKGQVHVAQDVLQILGLENVLILGLSKGPQRKSGLETLWKINSQSLLVSDHLKELNILLEIRDEAHRFAITGHRKKQIKSRHVSSLEQIAGIGSKRRRALLQQFGGLQGLKGASMDEIAKTPGVSQALARKIYEALR